MTEVIRFYRQGDAWGEFSNFSAHPIELDGERWSTTEHYFQAQNSSRRVRG
jgi:N-glycosidase YbiA